MHSDRVSLFPCLQNRYFHALSLTLGYRNIPKTTSRIETILAVQSAMRTHRVDNDL